MEIKIYLYESSNSARMRRKLLEEKETVLTRIQYVPYDQSSFQGDLLCTIRAG